MAINSGTIASTERAGRTRSSSWRPLLVVLAAAGPLASVGCAAAATATNPNPYVLLAPLKSTTTYLMDLNGQVVHTWKSGFAPALSVYLLPNGNLLRTETIGSGSFAEAGGNGGRVQLFDWDGNTLWTFEYATDSYQTHHDVKWMPNGHILMVAWEKRSGAEAIAAGRDPSTIPADGMIWADHVIEVDPSNSQIVWVWRLWDHLLPPGAAPSEHPELVDPNTHATATLDDWTHVNAIDYNATLDQVMISSRNLSEIWVIDHSTTTAEAAGHTAGRHGVGGDLLFRWGDPANYGMPDPQQLFGQHNAHWIEDGLDGAGQILLFNNGDRTARPYSTAVQLAPTVQATGSYAFDASAGFSPLAPVWQYEANPPESLFAPIISSAQRLVNGHTLVCDGPNGHFIEVTTAGDTVFSYTVTDTTGAAGVQIFRATRYEGDYSGLADKTLTPQGPLRADLTP